MTTTVQITVVDDGAGHPLVVNVFEWTSHPDDARTTERHDIKPGESVTLRVHSHRAFNVMEAQEGN